MSLCEAKHIFFLSSNSLALFCLICVSMCISNVGATQFQTRPLDSDASLFSLRGNSQGGDRRLLKNKESLLKELHNKRHSHLEKAQAPTGPLHEVTLPADDEQDQDDLQGSQEATAAMKALSSKFQELTNVNNPHRTSALGFVDRASLEALTKSQLVEEAYRAIQERDRAQLAAARIAYNCTSQVEKLSLKNTIMKDKHGERLKDALTTVELEKKKALEWASKHEELTKTHEDIARRHEKAAKKNEAMELVLRKHVKLVQKHLEV